MIQERLNKCGFNVAAERKAREQDEAVIDQWEVKWTETAQERNTAEARVAELEVALKNRDNGSCDLCEAHEQWVIEHNRVEELEAVLRLACESIAAEQEEWVIQMRDWWGKREEHTVETVLADLRARREKGGES